MTRKRKRQSGSRRRKTNKLAKRRTFIKEVEQINTLPVGDAKQDEKLGDVKQDEKLGDAKQDEKLGDAKQDEKLDDAKQDEKLDDGKQDEKLDDAKQDEKLGDAKQDEKLGDAKQDEKLGDAKQGENSGDKQNENVDVAKQDENVNKEKQPANATAFIPDELSLVKLHRKQCCVPGCKDCGRHRIPMNYESRKKWLIAIKRENWDPGPQDKVCYSHFKEDDYTKVTAETTTYYVKNILKKGAIPSIFAWSEPTDAELLKTSDNSISKEKAISNTTSTEVSMVEITNDENEETPKALDKKGETQRSVRASTQASSQQPFSISRFYNANENINYNNDNRMVQSRNRNNLKTNRLLQPPKTIIQLRLGKPTKADGIDLMMECIEEELSPWQEEANKKAVLEYTTTMNMIEALKNGILPPALQAKMVNQSSNTESSTLPTEEVLPTRKCIHIPGQRGRPRQHPVADNLENISSPVLSVAALAVSQNPKTGILTDEDLKGTTTQKFTFQLVQPNSWTLVQPEMPSSNVNKNSQGKFGHTIPQIKSVTAVAQIKTLPAILQVKSIPAGPQIKSVSSVPLNKSAPAVPQAKTISLLNPVPFSPLKPSSAISDSMSKPTTPIAVKNSSTTFQNGSFLSDQLKSNTLKRPSSSPTPPAKKKPFVSIENKQPVDEDFYGIFKGDPNHVDVKGAYKFKCHLCTKNLLSNIRAMSHLQAHMENSKQYNLDLSDLTVCKYCFVQFETPYAMQSHMEDVHLNNSQLMCRICERDYQDKNSLLLHMKTSHKTREMPYVCGICTFRSSRYNDVIDHFGVEHYNTDKAMCRYCLKVFTIKITSCGTGILTHFSAHLQRHQLKSARKCANCKLTFLNIQEARRHRMIDHVSFEGQKDVEPLNLSIMNSVMFNVPEEIPSSLSKAKSLNAPQNSRAGQLRNLRLVTFDAAQCVECRTIIYCSDHFMKYLECTLCRFATNCGKSYANHMFDYHSGGIVRHQPLARRQSQLNKCMFCLCGYSGKLGNVLANHLVRCRKKSCYPSQQIAFIYVDDDGDNLPFQGGNDQAALLNILGLVKRQPPFSDENEINPPIKLRIKASQSSKARRTKESPENNSSQICSEILLDILEDIFTSKSKSDLKEESKTVNLDAQESVAKESDTLVPEDSNKKKDYLKSNPSDSESKKVGPVKLQLSASLKKTGKGLKKMSELEKESKINPRKTASGTNQNINSLDNKDDCNEEIKKDNNGETVKTTPEKDKSVKAPAKDEISVEKEDKKGICTKKKT